MTATFQPHLRRDVAVVVPAAGAGVRLGGGQPKALRPLGGEPLLSRCCRNLAQAPSVGLIVIAAPKDSVEFVSSLVPSAHVVAGGATRQESVAAALAAVPAEFEIILVHDAARALTPPSLIEAVAAAVREGQEAVIPALAVVDTIKRVDEQGRVTATVDRAQLRAIQTPQGFRRGLLVKAHAAAADSHTDDAGMVEQLGAVVHTVPGHPHAFKITTPLDLVIAQALLEAGQCE
ncbi:2-C-methyl-D-erythritol 4-phosphate cytidylyltransferase [Rhizocola hellebori]|uniref:2-C-methyl-D-erythritol 4-phosphate cytidylyltransferase n=1 Tax=Rhizocola hellebori TaxID=1392758 RepID=UPI001EF1A0B7|nr:2-C-methyl-D-erythritol 4-phosphate cytidylyltransferase [Rhizocola hellebori]